MEPPPPQPRASMTSAQQQQQLHYQQQHSSASPTGPRLSTSSRTSATSRASIVGVSAATATLPPLNSSGLAGGLSLRHGHFVDPQGRVQILHGVNLGGASKLPFGYSHTDPLPSPSAFFDGARHASFVDRPFPLEDADLHFARLRRWGLTFVRLIVTWEAIEHEGPGIYDRAYLAYVRALVEKAAQYDILIYVDPHQDVWSRWTGGDGAPMWTLEAVGFEPRHFAATKAALCIETCGLRSATQFPKMIWPSNYFKLAAATMFTLFWGGKRLAPSCHVNGVQVQDFLQSHYLDAIAALATALSGLKNVVGFGSMNEPACGYIGVKDLAKCFQDGELKYDFAPTPFQGMCLGEAIPQVVGRWSNGFMQHVLGFPDSREKVDPQGVRAWKAGHRCIWMDEGVWKIDADGTTPKLLKPRYFADVDFGRDCYVPFAAKFAERIYRILPHTLLFVELPPLEFSSTEFPNIPESVIPRAVNATHWYDGVTLFLQTWRPYFTVDPKTKMPAFGYHAVRRMHERQLKHIKDYGKLHMNNAPCLIGETGIPYNLNRARAYKTGDYSAQRDALTHTISCLEANLLSFTLWCYTPDNCNKFGDLWNLEDLSIVSVDTHPPKHEDNNVHVEDRDMCARAILAFSRPKATKIAGIPTKSIFSTSHAKYVLEYSSSTLLENGKLVEHISAPTEVFVPHVQYPKGYNIVVSDGKYDVEMHDGWDVITYRPDEKSRGASHSLVLTTKDANVNRLRRMRELQQHGLAVCVAGLVVLLVYYLAR